MYAHAHPPVQFSRPASPDSVFESPLVRRPSAVEVGLNFDTPMPFPSQQTSEVASEIAIGRPQTSAQIAREIATKVAEAQAEMEAEMEAKLLASDNTVLAA